MPPLDRHNGDTIVALSTPHGYSGIGVIRVSGPDARTILGRIFQPSNRVKEFRSRRAMYGTVQDPETGRVLDDGMALFLKGPSTYTGEDMVELSLHGSPVVLDSVIEAIFRCGARPAQRGEFTRRAFLSGKLDLIQAEAVIDLIEAVSPLAAQEARARLDRTVSAQIHEISNALKDLLAAMEAHIDFDEDEEESPPNPLPDLRDILRRIDDLRRSAKTGRMRREGLATAIVGKPNVGKSTLFNALLQTNRTIVTPFPGTTRDTVEERLVLDGISFLLTDTAGIRRHPEPVEEEGIRRSLEKIEDADLVIAVLDGSAPPDAEDDRVLDECRSKETVLVLNKMDLGVSIANDDRMLQRTTGPRVPVSAKTGQGLDSLRALIREIGEEKTKTGPSQSVGSLSPRGLLLAEAAAIPLTDLLSAYEHGEDVRPEIVSFELREALSRLEEITGESVQEGVLERIFERFCVGK